GGSGADGGDGKDVTVTQVGNIATYGSASNGIQAQSIGGGGGNASFNFTGGVNKNTNGFALSIGGEGGSAGRAGDVTVTSTGNLATAGDNSNAIFAQSVGGGGGNATGGDSDLDTDLNYVLDAVGAVAGVASDPAKSISIGIGGVGGSAGIGGDVAVTTNGALVTQGASADGIFAQSVGGGGGSSTSNSASYSGDNNFSLQVGIPGAGGGHGGDVNVTASGSIATSGKNSYGIQAQSVGGGGGTGGSVSSDLMQTSNTISVGVGGSGGTGGYGG